MSKDLPSRHLFICCLMIVMLVIAVVVPMKIITVMMMMVFMSFPVLFGIAENFSFLYYYDLNTYL